MCPPGCQPSRLNAITAPPAVLLGSMPEIRRKPVLLATIGRQMSHVRAAPSRRGGLAAVTAGLTKISGWTTTGRKSRRTKVAEYYENIPFHMMRFDDTGAALLLKCLADVPNGDR